MDLTQAIHENNALMRQMIAELQSIRESLSAPQVDTCTAQNACKIIGVANSRYLRYFVENGILTRRQGVKGFLYFKNECQALAQKIKENPALLPKARELYAKS